jgi:hypothetical protein
MASRTRFDLDQNRDEMSSAERGAQEQRAQIDLPQQGGRQTASDSRQLAWCEHRHGTGKIRMRS